MRTIDPRLSDHAGPDCPRWAETLRDGSHVLIRLVRREDAAAERAFTESLTPQWRRYRFLGEVRHPSTELLARLDDVDYQSELAFAAVVHDDAKDKFVGVCRYSASADGSACECAVHVLDEWRHKGLGTLLMTRLIEVARRRGIDRMWSVETVENLEMADLARHLGFKRTQDAGDGSRITYELQM